MSLHRDHESTETATHCILLLHLPFRVRLMRDPLERLTSLLSTRPFTSAIVYTVNTRHAELKWAALAVGHSPMRRGMRVISYRSLLAS
jgi:hypothetical protein